MSPVPGPPPGEAGRPSAARHCLLALLLAVLALVGGASAGGTLPVRATAALPGATVPTVPTAPTATPGDLAPTATTAPGLPVQQATAEAPRTDPPTPPPATVDRGSDTTPWAAAEHPRAAHQLPPPGPGGLVPNPARAPLPRSVPWSVRTAPVPAVQRPRVALPGVRGPPSAGLHRPGDRIPVPRPINAAQLPPS
ncbi:hypothetical protein ACFZAT_09755 [Streptomyces sp. NPDC008163]|uniref:hypothetical protein n=1 Tax=Streptomyces sp. NPDC008163 TaxID=3364818 RepID=UPI0036E087FB